MMSDAIRLEPIETQIVEGHLAVPHGMTPIYLHVVDGRMIAHVEGWTVKKEYDHNRFDLYPLNNARLFSVRLKVNGENVDQDWYDSFGEPTKEAMKFNGEWDIRERTKTAT
jgi:hypothetical protein